MFDIAFSEMMIIALVALVVIGPEKLPRVARQAGQWIGKLQRYVSDVKSDLNRQVDLEELRRMQTDLQQAAQGVEASVTEAVSQVRTEFDDLSASLGDTGHTIAPPSAPTDWDKVYAVRRTRERLKDRRREREKELKLLRRLR